jgi:hypothetical protein
MGGRARIVNGTGRLTFHVSAAVAELRDAKVRRQVLVRLLPGRLLEGFKGQAFQANRVAHACFCEFDDLLGDQCGHGICSVHKAKRIKHVVKDDNQRGDVFRVKYARFEKSANWHQVAAQAPSTPIRSILNLNVKTLNLKKPVSLPKPGSPLAGSIRRSGGQSWLRSFGEFSASFFSASSPSRFQYSASLRNAARSAGSVICLAHAK